MKLKPWNLGIWSAITSNNGSTAKKLSKKLRPLDKKKFLLNFNFNQVTRSKFRV